jgi:hypothetical protein
MPLTPLAIFSRTYKGARSDVYYPKPPSQRLINNNKRFMAEGLAPGVAPVFCLPEELLLKIFCYVLSGLPPSQRARTALRILLTTKYWV